MKTWGCQAYLCLIWPPAAESGTQVGTCVQSALR